jgi:hypothetical protein
MTRSFLTFKKLTKFPEPFPVLNKDPLQSAEAPSLVPNIRLNCLTSVQFLEPYQDQQFQVLQSKLLHQQDLHFLKILPVLKE